jgi:type II secretory pathway component PulF
MATAASRNIKEFVFEWEGKDRNGKQVRGEIRAGGENQVQASLRRQGDQTQGHCHLHTPASHHDESRCALAAIL